MEEDILNHSLTVIRQGYPVVLGDIIKSLI